ncbi:oleoyl-ACP hydrolase [Streptomyces capoamus]|uniref:Oleoyl-ACP hydrolase n=1 Tax=Streptomyces capoamus TaxID=68183 RepID=A0A919C3M5_9ACTN|nr:alpha/beta fold hydrolase [Streptomyces capoamus]GGW16466.1 oleoyl-ACP hydrolase [Streptomyces libani subsp. rufus]GHG42923.1 oleoyl-ACP hydrolase [Streptomyces capoamus]
MSVRTTAQPPWWSQLPPGGEPGPVPRARLLVVPHSGGGPNRYLRLLGGLADDIEVLGLTLPGRERRRTERPGATLDEVLASLSAIRRPELPTLVLGHSLGATLGLHLAHALGEHCVGLIASGQEPRDGAGRLSEQAGDEDVLRLLERGGDMPSAVLEHEGLRAYLLELLRTDLRLGRESAERSRGLRIDAPITVLCGREDRLVDQDKLAGWRAHTSADCEVRVFPGGHFALFDPNNLRHYIEAVERHFAAVAELAS